MKFHEVILVLKLQSGYDFVTETYLQSSKGNNSKLYIQELWFLHSAGHPMLVNISMKFYEDTLNGLKVIERT